MDAVKTEVWHFLECVVKPLQCNGSVKWTDIVS